MDPHIFPDPDPGSQNVANLTDPDPKHCFWIMFLPRFKLLCQWLVVNGSHCYMLVYKSSNVLPLSLIKVLQEGMI